MMITTTVEENNSLDDQRPVPAVTQTMTTMDRLPFSIFTLLEGRETEGTLPGRLMLRWRGMM
jgi:hypothetical protein